MSSIQLRTAQMPIHPKTYDNGKGTTYFSTDLMEPVTYNLEFSPEGKKSPKQMKDIVLKAEEEGLEVDVEYTNKKGRFGQVMVIYDVNLVRQNTAKTV